MKLMDENEFLESYVDILGDIEGKEGGDTTTDIFTRELGIVDTLGIDPADYPNNPRGLAKAVAEKNIQELKRIGVNWDELPLSMKYNALDMQFNFGSLNVKAKNYLANLKTKNYAGAINETLDALSASDPKDGKQRPVKGIALRRAKFYNLVASDLGIPLITSVDAVNQDNAQKSAKFTYRLDDGKDIVKPFTVMSLHSRSVPGAEKVLGFEDKVVIKPTGKELPVSDLEEKGIGQQTKSAFPMTGDEQYLDQEGPIRDTGELVEPEESSGILDRIKNFISLDTDEEKKLKEIRKQEPEVLDLPDELSEARNFNVLRKMYQDKKFNEGGLSLSEQMNTIQDPAVKQDTNKTTVEKLKDVAKFGAEFIPGVGEAMAVKRVSDAMDEKDYVGAGIETAAGALGLLPIVGDVAGKGLRKVFSRKEIEDASPSWFKETEVSKDIKPEDAQKTQITTTTSTYKKSKEILPEGKTLDFGAGKGVGAKEVGSDTYEPFPDKSFSPTYTDSKSIPSNSYDNITSLNVLNVVKPDIRSDIVQDIGRILKPNGTAIITTRGMDVFGNANNPVKGILADEPRAVITSTGTYQKGFTPKELKEYIESELGENFEVTNVRDLGKAGVKVKKNLEMAEGGAVPMEKQMSMFDNGGLMDEGGTIDPISGNDVPPGSTQEEVRDDIPAQLSEGEFVFPADVVRYIGLEKLMQMRQQAKMGLQTMDDMGQMGNSEEAIMPDNIPFELSDLDMDDDPVEMNTGGVAGVSSVPSQVPATSFLQAPEAPTVPTPAPTPTASTVPIAPTYTPPTQQAPPIAPDYSELAYKDVMSTPELAARLVDIINPTTGEKRTINFIPGVTPIPDGFVFASEYTAPKTQATSVTPVAGQEQVRQDTSSERRKDEEQRKQFEEAKNRKKIIAEMFGEEYLTGRGAKPFSDLLGKQEPGTVTTNGYIVGDNGEILNPITGEQEFLGLAVDLGLKDKPPLDTSKENGVNRRLQRAIMLRKGEERRSKITPEQRARDKDKAEKAFASSIQSDALKEMRNVNTKPISEKSSAEQIKKEKEKRADARERQRERLKASQERARERAKTKVDPKGDYGLGIAKGGLLSKPKPKPKKMRQGGLASR